MEVGSGVCQVVSKSRADRPLSYKLEEAARLLGVSVQTIRRRLLEPGDPLSPAPEPRPLRVSFESLHAARRIRARELGMYLEPPEDCTHPGVDELQREIERLKLENERLRRVAQTLRLSQSELLRSLGDFTDPVLPDN